MVLPLSSSLAFELSKSSSRQPTPITLALERDLPPNQAPLTAYPARTADISSSIGPWRSSNLAQIKSSHPLTEIYADR